MSPHVIARDTEIAADSRNAKTQRIAVRWVRCVTSRTTALQNHQAVRRVCPTPSFSLGTKCFDAIDILQ